MKKTIVLAALMMAPIAAGAASTKSDVPDEIAAQCAKQWPGDYRMQAYCIEKQTDSAIALMRTFDASKNGSVEQKIIFKCLIDWRKEPINANYSYDYRMANWCINGQMKAYKRIHG